MSTATTSRKAVTATAHLPGGRWYEAAELAAWVAGLNILVLVFTLAGGGVLGLAPAFVAAASVTRTRLRGDVQQTIRAFASTWRREFWTANAVMAPCAAVAMLLAANIYAFGPGGGPLIVVLWVALAVTGLTAIFALTMVAHYDLPVRRYAPTGFRYLLRNLPAAALVAAVTALAVVLTLVVPGLLPVLSVGAWVYAITAICLSCYARNDGLLEAEPVTHTPR